MHTLQSVMADSPNRSNVVSPNSEGSGKKSSELVMNKHFECFLQYKNVRCPNCCKLTEGLYSYLHHYMKQRNTELL